MENLLAMDDIFQASCLTYRTAQNVHDHVPTRQNTERCSCTQYVHNVCLLEVVQQQIRSGPRATML